MLPPALAPPTFTKLPAVILLGNTTSMVLGVAPRYDCIVKSIVIVNGGAATVDLQGYVGIGGREGYLFPIPTTLAAAGSASSWMVMDNEMRLNQGDHIRVMASVPDVATIMVFGDNIFLG